MKFWEYEYDGLPDFDDKIRHDRLINTRLDEGWELVSVVKISENRVRFYWKREKVPPPPILRSAPK